MRPVFSLKALAAFGATLALVSIAKAKEERFLKTMPTGTVLSGVQAKQSKTPFWDCGNVKINDKGNWGAVAGGKHKLFADVPETDPSVEDGTKGVRCTLKINDKTKHKMVNADLGETAE